MDLTSIQRIPTNQDKSAAGGPIRLYLSRQADGLPRYLLEQSLFFLAGWIPTLAGIGVRGLLYRLVLKKMAGWAAIENGVRLRYASNITLLYLVWSGGQDGRIFYSQAKPDDASSPGGWSPPVAISPPGMARNPQILSGADGTLFVCYTIPVNEERGAYLVISRDGGKSWSAPVQIFNGAAAEWPMVDRLELALAQDQSLYTIWARYPLPWSKVPESLYYAKSDDEGTTWSQANLFIDLPVQWFHLIATEQHILHFLWIENSNPNLIKHQVSTDGGSNWAPADSLYLPDGSVGEPGLTVDLAGQLHLAQFTQDDSGNLTINGWMWSQDGWSSEESFNPPARSLRTLLSMKLAISRDGKLVVSYSGEAEDQGNQVPEAKVFFTSRMVSLPADLSTPVPTTPQPLATDTATVSPTPKPTPMATQLPASVLSSAPQQSSGFLSGSYGGLIVGAGIAMLIVVVFFGVWSIRERFLK